VFNAALVAKANDTTHSTLDAWTRLDVSFTADATETWRFYIQQDGAGDTNVYWTAVLPEAGALGAYFDGDTDGAEWTGNADGSMSVYAPGKQRLIRLASEVDPPLEEAAALLRYGAQFYAEDPRAYSQNLRTVASTALSTSGGGKTYRVTYPRTYTASGGGLLSYFNSGTRPTPPVFRVYGLCVNPTIVCLTTGEMITLSGTVPAGAYLEVDVAARSLKMGGTVNQAGFLDAANTVWMEAPTGASSWQLLADSFDGTARLDLLARSAY
jgi:hypothetical protein